MWAFRNHFILVCYPAFYSSYNFFVGREFALIQIFLVWELYSQIEISQMNLEDGLQVPSTNCKCCILQYASCALVHCQIQFFGYGENFMKKNLWLPPGRPGFDSQWKPYIFLHKICLGTHLNPHNQWRWHHRYPKKEARTFSCRFLTRNCFVLGEPKYIHPLTVVLSQCRNYVFRQELCSEIPNASLLIRVEGL